MHARKRTTSVTARAVRFIVKGVPSLPAVAKALFCVYIGLCTVLMLFAFRAETTQSPSKRMLWQAITRGDGETLVLMYPWLTLLINEPWPSFDALTDWTAALIAAAALTALFFRSHLPLLHWLPAVSVYFVAVRRVRIHLQSRPAKGRHRKRRGS